MAVKSKRSDVQVSLQSNIDPVEARHSAKHAGKRKNESITTNELSEGL
jgi:hypothetical protein